MIRAMILLYLKYSRRKMQLSSELLLHPSTDRLLLVPRIVENAGRSLSRCEASERELKEEDRDFTYQSL